MPSTTGTTRGPVPGGPFLPGKSACFEVYALGFGFLALGQLGLFAASALESGLRPEPLSIGVILGVLIVYYNYRHKTDPHSPVVMAVCRGLIYLIAASVAAGFSLGPGLGRWSGVGELRRRIDLPGRPGGPQPGKGAVAGASARRPGGVRLAPGRRGHVRSGVISIDGLVPALDLVVRVISPGAAPKTFLEPSPVSSPVSRCWTRSSSRPSPRGSADPFSPFSASCRPGPCSDSSPEPEKRSQRTGPGQGQRLAQQSVVKVPRAPRPGLRPPDKAL